MNHSEFAEQEFGHARLGDPRRPRRVVRMTAQAMEKPAGTISDVYPKGAEREGAYRALESPYIRPEALELARDIACMKRMQEGGGGLCPVLVDKTSIQLPDRKRVRNFGSVGRRATGARGIQVMTAMALDPNGTPMGIVNQAMWARSETPSPPRRPGNKNRKRVKDRRPPEERESIYFVNAVRQAHALQVEHAPAAKLWFHIDREGDFWGVHAAVEDLGVHATIRMNREHVVRDAAGREMTLVHWLGLQPIQHWLHLRIPAHDGRPERKAVLSMRFGEVMLRLSVPGKKIWISRRIVFVDEPFRPRAKDRIQWILSTTMPVRSVDDASWIVEHYAKRWHVEDFHRTWKSGAWDIESSQLQSTKTFHCWGIITSSVAVRAEHIKHLSREQPDAPATVLFTQDEIDAMLLWRQRNSPKARISYELGQIPPLGHMTRFVAEMGGFTKSSKVLPGSTTIARGLERLAAFVEGLTIARELFGKTSG